MKPGPILTTLVLVLFTSYPLSSQKLDLAWKFNAGSKILASPTANNNNVYVGGVDGTFYAIDLKTGKESWRYETEGNIQAQALRFDDRIFFESANKFYNLSQETGKLNWQFNTGMDPLSFEYEGKTFLYKIDFFDDKRPSGIVLGNYICIGAGNGSVYILNKTNGIKQIELTSDELSPIRSTPILSGNTLYYGDWNGLIYAHDIVADKQLWKTRTYEGERPYPTFGGIASSFVFYDDKLFYGARNHVMKVLSSKTGEEIWTYEDPEGGWMIGDPVVMRDTVYIGGSDNFSMYAFNPDNGKKLWQHNGGKNIYTKPIVTNTMVIYTAGNGYNWTDPGVIYILDRMTGEELYKYETPNGIFSSPILAGDLVIFGCHDGYVYALNLVRDKKTN